MPLLRIALLALLIACIPAASQANALSPCLAIAPGMEGQALEGHFDYLLDSSGTLGLQDILSPEQQTRFQPYGAGSLNLGVIEDACWLRICIRNPQDKALELVIEPRTATLNHVELFALSADGSVQHSITGDLHPISQRAYRHRLPVTSFRVDALAETTIYLRIQTQAILETALTLYTAEAFVNKLPPEYLLYGMFYAAFLVAIFYNLFLFISLRDVNYLLYVLYAASFCSIWLYLDGLAHLHLWPETPWQQVWGVRVSNTLTCLFMVLFTSSFFGCRQKAPRLFRVLMAIALLCVVNSVMVCLLPLAEYKLPVRLAWLFAIPAVIFTAGLFLKRGFLRARYFFTAWLFVLAGATVFMLDMYLGAIPSSTITRSAWRIASVFEIIMLSLALADRINELNRKKNEAQEQALESKRTLAQRLEKEVSRRTAELEQRGRELHQANEELERLSRQDELTGLLNRRHFNELLNGEWRRMQRYAKPVCIIMCDLDHFKTFNDTFGHLAGDECLRRAARCVDAGTRRSADFCARYGGEEFVIVLPESEAEGGRRIAETIRLSIETMPPADNAPDVGMTMSFGVAALVPSPSLQPEDLLNLADEALYESKRQGRNRVTVNTPPDRETT